MISATHAIDRETSVVLTEDLLALLRWPSP
jgi:hypothetical protein